jgi:hypothetical protein
MPELVRERIMAGAALKAEAPAMQAARMVACKEIANKNPRHCRVYFDRKLVQIGSDPLEHDDNLHVIMKEIFK